MDLIYTDTARQDVGVLSNYRLDLAFGSDENDFEIVLDLNDHCCTKDCLLYIEGTEYGGIIDGIEVATADDKLAYCGRTWHGILASKIIEPDENTPYLVVSGEANMVIQYIIDRIGLSDLFSTLQVNSRLSVENYQFDRYIDAYSGLSKMLASVAGKLKFNFTNGQVILSAVPLVDYSKDEQFDNDSVELTIENKGNTVNHLICLGKGELEEREVIHLYKDATGHIGEKQAFFGIHEITAIYENNSGDKLMEDGIKKFEEYGGESVVEMKFSPDDDKYDVGDIIGAKELITGTFATEKITKKIVTIENDVVTIEYKVGE